NALDLHWKIEGVLNSIDLYLRATPPALSRSILWSLPLQQARFPDFRLERVASRPSQSSRPVTINWKLRNRRYTVAGTVWAFHPTSLVTLYGHLRRSNSMSNRRRVETA